MSARVCDAVVRIELEGADHRGAKVMVEHAGPSVLHHVQRSGDREGRHRYAAGHGLEHDEPEGIREAREHEHVGGGHVGGEFLAQFLSGEPDVRVPGTEALQVRTVSHHVLGPGQVEIQERLDVLFHGYPSHVHGQRPRPRQEGLGTRLEQVGIDAPGPDSEVAETPFTEVIGKGTGRHEGAGRAAVVPPQVAVGPAHGKRNPSPKVFREEGVERCGEGDPDPPAKGAGGVSEGSLGGYVDGVGPGLAQYPLDPFLRKERQTDGRISWAGEGREIQGRYEDRFVPQLLQSRAGLLQRTHDPVHLRFPSVGDDRDLHADGR